MNKLAFIIFIAFNLSTTSLLAEESVTSKSVDTQEETSPHAALKKTISDYMTAWSKAEPDYKSMYALENWERGEKLSEAAYMQSFDESFKIKEFKITKVSAKDDDVYEILVWVSHTVAKNAPAFVSRNKLMRSTLRQWWKKVDDKYVHLYHIEKENLTKMFLQQKMLNVAPAK